MSKILVEKLEGMAKRVYESFKVPVKMAFDESARVSYESTTVCYASKKGFINACKTKHKVRDHCHFTGRYRGALHSECNLSRDHSLYPYLHTICPDMTHICL